MVLLLLLFAVVAVVTAIGLCGYGVRTLADRRALRTGTSGALRGLAALAGAGACALYAWGLLGLCGAAMSAQDGGTDSAPATPCRTQDGTGSGERGTGVVGHRVTYVPLGFVCETSGGESYDSGDVPGYVNAGVAALGLTAAGCAVGAGYVSEVRARAEFRRREAG